jgi:hypothetical protein
MRPLSALCTAAAAAATTTPEQVHTAFATASSFRVAWTTNSSAPSVCAFGVSPTALTLNATGRSEQYLPGYGYHHSVLLAAPGGASAVYYRCGDGAAATTPVTRFALPPNASVPFSTMILGDWGWLDSQRAGGPMIPTGGLDANWSAVLTRELMESLFVNGSIGATWIVGDIAYADDSFGHEAELLSFGYERVYNG